MTDERAKEVNVNARCLSISVVNLTINRCSRTFKQSHISHQDRYSNERLVPSVSLKKNITMKPLFKCATRKSGNGSQQRKSILARVCHLFCSQFSKIVLRVEGKIDPVARLVTNGILTGMFRWIRHRDRISGDFFEVTFALLRRMPLKRKCPGGDAWKLAISRR